MHGAAELAWERAVPTAEVVVRLTADPAGRFVSLKGRIWRPLSQPHPLADVAPLRRKLAKANLLGEGQGGIRRSDKPDFGLRRLARETRGGLLPADERQQVFQLRAAFQAGQGEPERVEKGPALSRPSPA